VDERGPHAHPAAGRGELDRVAEQVDEHLSHVQRIAAQPGQRGRHADRQRESLLAHERLDLARHVEHERA
jgi:hypothetical protein